MSLFVIGRIVGAGYCRCWADKESQYPFMFTSKIVKPVSAAIMDQIIEATFGVELSKHGFEYVRHRKWVRSHKPEVRELFLIQALKGTSYSPMWGFSLDYVPHNVGKKVCWHRTSKSALLDLRYDPLDYEYPEEINEKWAILSLYGEQEGKRLAKRVMQRAVPQALKFFELVAGLDDLERVFESQMKKPAIRFGFFNYVQQPLAYAFTLAKLKRYDEAETVLNKHLEEYKFLPDVAGELQKLLMSVRRT